MSQRVKKPGRVDENQGKRRRRRPSGSDGEEDGTRSGSNSGGNSSFPSIGGMWTPRHLNDLKVSSIYNRNSAEAPAELYRKDLISAMKLADSEPLTPEEYWLITDPWKQEWEKGVQVPVNPESLPEPEVVVISPVNERSHDFRLPKKKYIRVTHDDFFNPDYHQLVSTAARAEKVCSYDLDDVDAAWLSCANADRGMQVLPVISEFLMEQVIEELELQCWEQVQTILKSQEGLGIEYDENVICDVCRSPESEEGNEMVFCDACNICVHQACYGITTIPSGSWLCRTCTLGTRPTCVLCPNVGGAMKATRSGQKWAHVACAIWIPEVSIGSVEKMEPITKISSIPQSRWSLICVLCKEKLGACIQCSVKTCKTAYHVTCAFKSGLEMKPIIVDENAEDGIKLRSYCQKHSVNTKKEKSTNSGSEEDGEKKKARAMTAEERNAARAEKLQQIESEFYKYVRLKDVSQNLAVDMDIVLLIFNYWKLKRKSLNNRPLVPPRPETTQLLTQQQEQDLEQMKMFVQLRQDLERVRNLCYMVSRREKLSRSYFRLREQTFQKQVAILSDKSTGVNIIAPLERCAIVDANHGPSIYDQIYSQNGADCSLKDYDTLVSLIAGEEKKDRTINGVIKPKKSSAGSAPGTYVNSGNNSYKRQFVNGARRKNLIGESCSSLSESEASVSDNVVASTRKLKLSPSNSGRKPLSYLFDTDSSLDGITSSSTRLVNAKSLTDKGGKLLKGRSRRIQRTLKSAKKSSTSDSDELDLPMPKTTGGNVGKTDAPIYSDSDSEESSRKQNDSPVATKASVKEFTRKSNKKEAPLGALANKIISGPKGKPKGPGRKKKGFEPTELIVPQREAAKKASESIRTVKQRKDLAGSITEASPSSYDLLNNVPSPSPTSPSRSKERESDPLQKTSLEKIKDNLSEQTTGKTRPKNNRANKSRSPDKKGMIGKPCKRGSNDGSSKNVSYVPQRQAAKKAAEHIRSGLSNIVAARLIIEDEMEAARKKTKDDKTAILKKPMESPQASNVVKKTGKIRTKVSPTEDDKIKPEESSSVSKSADKDTAIAKPRAKKRSVSKGEEGRPILKGGKKDLMSNTSVGEIVKDRDTDWPFLDRGSQSECRRSRERSSSSSSSSSSGSSSSNSSSSSRSSASSRSSSPASASPESNAHLRKTPNALSNQASSPPASLSATPRGPSRKLKTSDRSPDRGSQHETTTGTKPTPKSRGPSKLRPGGGSTGGTSTTSPGSRAQQLTSLGTKGRPSRQHKISKSSSSSSSSECSPSPSSSRRNFENNNKSPQEEGKRREGEPSAFKETEKNLISAAEFEVPASSKSSPKSQTRVKAKALINSTIAVSGVLDLSSDSENDSKVPSGTSQQGIPKGKGNDLPTSSLSPSSTHNHSKPATSGTKTKTKDISNLSDSDNDGAEEKENSCRTSEVSNSEATSSCKNKAQKSSVSSSSLSIFSPLTPSSENKEKELCTFSRSSDTEPELKRARMDSGANNSQISHLSGTQSTSTNSGTPLHTNSGGNFTTTIGSLHVKSLFSPSRVGHDHELLDFDTELYDLARSVSADYSQCDEDGGMGGASGSLPFSFSQSLLCREDNSEDSAQATLNLVEKLRLQHARKSGCPRSSMDGSDLSMIEDGSKSPPSSVRLSCEKNVDTSQSTGPIVDTSTIPRDENIFDESSKSVGNLSTVSPGRDKCTQGDERWVPPSSSDTPALLKASSPEIETELEQVQKRNTNMRDKPTTVPASTGRANINTSHPCQQRLPDHQLEQMQHPVDSIFVADHLVGTKNQFHKGEEEPRRHESESNMYSEISDRRNKKEMQIESQSVSKEISHLPGSTTVSSLCSSASHTTSPVISPEIKLPRGTQSMHFSHPGQNITPGNIGFPSNSSNSPFLYPLAGTPSVANVANALAAPIGSNSPHASSFFRPHAQHPGLSHQPSTSSLSPGYPHQSFPSSSNFMQAQQSESHGQSQKSKTDNIVSPPSVSPNILPPRRSSNYLKEKSIAESLVSGVTSGMPPLAKPSIASPSMILAANNVKNIIPPPPPQSTVAQIIENVVNNHTNNTSIPIGAQDILSAILNIAQQSSNVVSTSGLAPSATSKQKVSMASNAMSGLTKASSILSTVSSLSESEIRDSILNGGLIGSTKGFETAKAFSTKDRDYDNNTKESIEANRGNSSTAMSPRGRGRRATTPRAAAKTDKVLTACETNGVKGKGRGERKSSTGTSPARAAKQPGSRRGGGRGRGRGKGVAVTRKDLAGTVYDIDFDEFEENHDEKLDLRMLRERRKSSDIHVENKLTKSEVLNSPSDHHTISVEASPKHRELDVPRSVGDHKNLYSCSIPSNENNVPIPQPPLPGPVDMRTYSLGAVITENHSGGTPTNKNTFIHQKETRIGDISSIFSSSSDKASIKNEYEEVDEALEALSAAPKASAFSSFSRSSNPQTCMQQYTNSSTNQQGSTYSPSLQITREPLIGTLTEPDMKSSIGDFSRNQLKVKIKGPFLDANYGSHSIPGDVSGNSQHYQSTFHHSAGQSQTIGAPTNNLRRMRKKELLRQYWTQDMNMDGSSCASGYEAEISGISANSMAHPINRSVITIPKAVASMAIIPTKDDYRLESMPNSNESPYGFGGMSSCVTKESANGGSATEKRKRNRGMREMAALGIITCDAPRERRRDRMETSSMGNYSSEMGGKKRGKANKRPVRSTFIPPTLVDPDAPNNEKKSGIKNLPIPSLLGSNAISTVVQTLNHPTPKLKIKFGDMSKNLGGLLANAAGHSNALSDSSDKEAPNKKAKGRPPKKRGISEIVSSAPPSMEELKRENMKFREMMMQEFAVEERKEILQLKGTRKHKKRKRKAGLLGRETDETGRPISPEVKVIAEGSKLILRFGKGRSGVGVGNELSGSKEAKLKPISGEGGALGAASDIIEDLIIGEHDSGFTGSSEGSGGSVSELTGASKERLPSSSIAANCSAGQIKTEPSPVSMGSDESYPITITSVSIPVATTGARSVGPNHSGDVAPQVCDVKSRSVSEQGNCSKADKIMPIRLKLSRCGYALQQKPETCAQDGVPPTPTPAKQSDSCEVR